MARSKGYETSEQQKFLKISNRNKANKRQHSLSGKSKGEKAWIKVRHRVRKKLLGG